MATSLGVLQNLCQFSNPHIYIYKSWNIGKDWFSSCLDIRQYRPILDELQNNFHLFPHFNSETTEPIVTIFSHDLEQSVELLMRAYLQGDTPFHFGKTERYVYGGR